MTRPGKEGEGLPPQGPLDPIGKTPCIVTFRAGTALPWPPGDGPEAVRFDGLMQELVNRSMPDELYWQLDAEAKADRKRRQQERKRRRKPPPTRASVVELPPSINVTDLKKRIFNPHVSRENVIKALEALPPAERRTTIAGLPPGLRRKLGHYLKGGRH